jgi:4-diphosphocytidyl-2-C-methyl-D-erythritol kinase
MMRGVGEVLGPALGLPPLFAVLVNPRVPVETPRVFKALALAPGQDLPGAPHPDLAAGAAAPAIVQAVQAGRNDLEPPARAVEPVVGEALAALGGTSGCRVARMSGSGATCFALYDDCKAAAAAAKALRRERPAWWVKATSLR